LRELALEEELTSGGYGYTFYVQPERTFVYRPVGYELPTALWIKFGLGKRTDTEVSMRAEYSFQEQPEEMATRVTAYGTNAAGENITYTAKGVDTNGDGFSDDEDTWKYVREVPVYVYATTTEAELLTIATAHYERLKNVVSKAEVQFASFPYVLYGGSHYSIRPGFKVYVTCTHENITAQPMYVSESIYREPERLTRMILTYPGAIRSGHPDDLSEKLESLGGLAAQGMSSKVYTPPLGYMARVVDIEITPTAYNKVTWTAGSVTFSDGSEWNFNAGSLTFTGTRYLYVIQGNSTLQNTATFSETVGADRVLAAVISEATTTDQLAYAGTPFAQDILINRDKVVDGLVNDLKLADEAVSAAKIATSAVLEGHIHTEAIVARHIQADQIDAVHINAEMFTSEKISTGVLTALKINVVELSAITAHLGNVDVAGGDVIIGDDGIKIYRKSSGSAGEELRFYNRYNEYVGYVACSYGTDYLARIIQIYSLLGSVQIGAMNGTLALTGTGGISLSAGGAADQTNLSMATSTGSTAIGAGRYIDLMPGSSYYTRVWYGMAPANHEVYPLGYTSKAWSQVVSKYLYASDGTVHSYQAYDDFALLKRIGHKTLKAKGKSEEHILDSETLPPGVVITGEDGESKYVDMGALHGFSLSVLQKILHRLEVLEAKVNV
jgi:hypothetical protein